MFTYEQTGLTLYEWASIMGVDIWELAQFGLGFPELDTSQASDAIPTGACDRPFFQFPYQRDYLSREEIAQAIRKAEELIAEELGFWTYPKYIQGERISYPRPYNYPGNPGYGGLQFVPRVTFKLNSGYFIGGGTLARTLISAGVAVTRLDEDGDSVFETFEIAGLATSVTDANEIALYFKAADRVGIDKTLSETWRIRPIFTEISAGAATIRGHAALIAKPILSAGRSVASLDVDTAGNFVTTVDVYRVYRDDTATAATTKQGIAEWTNHNCDTEECDTITSPLCLAPKNAVMGIVYGGDVSDNCWYINPEWVTVNYQAGIALGNGIVDRKYADIVAKLATALLAGFKCGCDRSNRIMARWQQDLTIPVEGGQAIALPDDLTTNPFGRQAGAYYAWQQLQDLKNVSAIRI